MSSRSGQTKDATNTLAFNDVLAGGNVEIDRYTRQLHQGNYHVFSSGAVALGPIGAIEVAVSVNDATSTNGIQAVAVRMTTAITGITDHAVALYEGATFSAATWRNATNRNRAYPTSTPDDALPGAMAVCPPGGATTANLNIFAQAPTISGFGAEIYVQVIPGLSIYTTDWFILTRGTGSGRNYLVRLQSLSTSGQTASLNIDAVVLPQPDSIRALT